jgi:hypothetical protein
VRILLVLIALALLVAGGFAWLWASANKADEPVRVGVGIFGGCGGIGFAVAFGKRLKQLLQRVTIEIDAFKVTYTKRLPDRIGRDEWSRAVIAGVRTVPAGLSELLRRQYRLQLWFVNGRAAILYTGPAASVSLLTQAIADALGFPLPAARTPTTLHPSHRLTLQNYPTGPEFILNRPRLSWEIIPFLFCAAAIAFALEYFVFSDPGDRSLFQPPGERWWSAIRITMGLLVVFALTFAFFRRFCRKKILAIQTDRLILVELSLTSPIRQQWPIKQVSDFHPHDDGRLSMQLLDGQSIDLLTGENAADMRYIADQFNSVLRSPAPPPPALNPPAHTPESPHPPPSASNPAPDAQSPDT